MSTEAEDEDGAKVHRLLDMVVEEVSLVDRAANQRRFLVIKRKTMPKDDQGKGGKPPKDGDAKPKGKAKPPFPPEKAGAGAETDAEGAAPAPKGKKPPPFPPREKQPAKKAEGDVLTIATRALETLTDAVERMGEAEDEGVTKVAGELVEELAEITAELAAAAGVEPVEDEDAEKSADGADAATQSTQTATAEVRALLGQVSQLLAAATTKADEGARSDSDALGHTDTDPAPPPVPDPAERFGAQLSELHTSLRALGEAVREQGARLQHLEKAAPLPNSRATERAPAASSSGDGWPLDMNRPLDRGRVDKSVSFHDD